MGIDAGTRRRLAVGLFTNWIAKLAGTIIQLVQVPFLLHFWTVAVYGNWLIAISIPSYLSFSNIGFGSVAGNEMTMAESRGDRETALRVFQSCWWLIVLVMLATSALLAVLLVWVPVATLLNVHAISTRDTKWIVGFLSASVLLGQLEQLLQSAYRSVGRYSYGTFLKSCLSLAAFSLMLVPVALGYGPRTAAMVFAAANIGGTVLLAAMVKRDLPWIEFGWEHARFAEIRRLSPLAFAFMGFPMGNALNLQGTLQAVSYAMGPVAVVIFATARTVSRVALQMVQMVNNTFEPEFSKSFGQRNTALLRTLHRRACQAALLIALPIVAALIAGGPFLLSHWTHGKVPPSRPLLSLLLLGVVLYSLWSTSATIVTATNRHKRLALVYVAATGVTVLVTWLAARHFGLYGAAASLLLSEFLMTLYVLPTSLRLAHDTFPAFLRSLLTAPQALHPHALRSRLRRARPALEG